MVWWLLKDGTLVMVLGFGKNKQDGVFL